MNHELNIHHFNIYPLTIVCDRYNGVYSGGKYTAWNEDFENLPVDISGDDMSCGMFWEEFNSGIISLKNFFGEKICVGLGNTPNEALSHLYEVLNKRTGSTRE